MNNNFNNTQNINNKNYKKIFLFLLIFVLMIITCLLTAKIILKKNQGIKTRTIMIYMVGSDLESRAGLATVDLNGIDYDEMDNENINVVLMAGGSKEWNNNFIDEDESSIFELTTDGFKKVKTQKIKNMGDSKVFTDYLNYVYENYKTDEYNLIFWDHGGAIYGSQMDELSEDILSLEEMNEGLKKSPFKSKKLETIIFRTCLNGTLEVANVLDDYSSYLIASEEITYGASFTSVLNFINEIEGTDSGYDIGYKFIDSYKNQIKKLKEKYSNNSDIYSTYSIVNLEKVDNLTKSLNEFIKEIDVEDNYKEIAKIRSNLYQYAYTQSDTEDYDTVDLYNLINKLKKYDDKKANKVLKNIEEVVEYNWATNSNSRGISIYFPYNADNSVKKMFLQIYKSFDDLNSYYNFINEFYNIQTGNTKTYSFDSNKINVNSNSTSNKDADFTLELTDEQKQGFAKAKYIVFKDNKDGYYQPIYIGGEAVLKGNTLIANIKDRQLKVIDKSDKDFKGYILTLIESENSENYIKYNTNVVLQNIVSLDNYKMDNAQMNLILNKKTNQISINNVILTNKNKLTPSSISADLNEYKNVAFGSFKYKVLDQNGNYTTNWDSNGIFEGYEIDVKNIAFEIQEFDSNYDYYCVFLIKDINNKTYYSKMIKMN